MTSSRASSGRDLSGALLDNRYRVRSKLGEGGMAQVYLAADERLGRAVVVKVPLEIFLTVSGFRERFAQEIHALINLDHPFIGKILDRGEVDGVPYAVLQYLAGGSLMNRIQEAGGSLSPEQISGWLPRVAGALDFIHNRNFLHRDIKPGNILFDGERNVYIADFGIAKVLGDKEFTNLTQTGTLPGTVAYMAPEAGENRAPGPPYDQYALAVVVYQALSGDLPHAMSDSPISALVQKIITDPVPLSRACPHLPSGVCDAVMRALSPSPEDRYASCASFAEAFAEGLDTATVAEVAADADDADDVATRVAVDLADVVQDNALAPATRALTTDETVVTERPPTEIIETPPAPADFGTVVLPDAPPLAGSSRAPVIMPDKPPVILPEEAPVILPGEAPVILPEEAPAAAAAKPPVIMPDRPAVVMPDRPPVIMPDEAQRASPPQRRPRPRRSAPKLRMPAVRLPKINLPRVGLPSISLTPERRRQLIAGARVGGAVVIVAVLVVLLGKAIQRRAGSAAGGVESVQSATVPSPPAGAPAESGVGEDTASLQTGAARGDAAGAGTRTGDAGTETAEPGTDAGAGAAGAAGAGSAPPVTGPSGPTTEPARPDDAVRQGGDASGARPGAPGAQSAQQSPPPDQPAAGQSAQTPPSGVESPPAAAGAEAAAAPVGETRAPRRISTVAPDYPEVPFALAIEGEVTVTATIDVNGAVNAATVAESLHPDLDGAAIAAVLQWKYEPALADGEPREYPLSAKLVFTLPARPAPTPVEDPRIEAARQLDTIRFMSELVAGIESFRRANGAYPRAVDQLGPFLQVVPTADSWGASFWYHGQGDDYWLVSFGRDGRPGPPAPAGWRVGDAFEADIRVHAGAFDQVPEAVETAAPAGAQDTGGAAPDTAGVQDTGGAAQDTGGAARGAGGAPPSPPAGSGIETVPLTADVTPPSLVVESVSFTLSRAIQDAIGLTARRVSVRCLVMPDGTVAEARVMQVNPEIPIDAMARAFQEAARSSAVNAWRFHPAVKDGVPVAVWHLVHVRYEPRR